MRLTVEPGRLAVCRLGAAARVEAWMWTGTLASVTRRADELSVVCDEASVPPGVEAEAGWRALRVAGPLDFSLTGVLASLAAPLAHASIPIFVVSTFDTDVILVRASQLDAALDALRGAGHTVGSDASSAEKGGA